MSEAFLFCKRNDKTTAPGKEHLGLKHLDPVDVVCSTDSAWKGRPIEPMIKDRMRRAYVPIQIDPKNVPLFRSYLKEHNGNKPISEYRPRIKRLNPKKLKKVCGIDDIESRVHTDEALPILNGLLLSADDFDDASLLSNDLEFRDVMAISTGSATVGAGGGAPNYLTWVLAIADIANLTGNLTFTQVNNTSENAVAIIEETLGGFTLDLTSDTPTLGNSNSGWLIDIAHDDHMIQWRHEGAGTTYTRNLRFKRTVAGSSTIKAAIYIANIATGFNGYIYNNIVDGNSLAGEGIRLNDDDPVICVYNNMVYNAVTGLGVNVSNVSSKIENNAVTGCTSGINANAKNLTFLNNAIMGNTTNYVNIGGATGNNNASNDATGADGDWNAGSENQVGLTIGNEWQSVIPGDGDTFLKPVAGSVIAANGIAPTCFTNLIDGVAWTSEIGAKSKPSAVSAAIFNKAAINNSISISL